MYLCEEWRKCETKRGGYRTGYNSTISCQYFLPSATFHLMFTNYILTGCGHWLFSPTICHLLCHHYRRYAYCGGCSTEKCNNCHMFIYFMRHSSHSGTYYVCFSVADSVESTWTTNFRVLCNMKKLVIGHLTDVRFVWEALLA